MSQRSASSHTTHPRVLVIYHRDDAETQAQRLIQTLRRRFGADDVKTCYDLPPSEFFSAGGRIVLVVLVGKKWPKLKRGRRPDPHATRADDTVALALASALEIIPMLVNGASMPEKTNLSRLASRSMQLWDAQWEQDIETLAERLGRPDAQQSESERDTDDSVAVNLSREAAVNLINALTIYLGSAPEAYGGVKKGGGKLSVKVEGRAKMSVMVGAKIVGSEIGDIVGNERASQMKNLADVVSCTVFSPPKVSPGATFMVQVFAHLPKDAGRTSRLAKQAARESEKLGSKTLDSEVERGTKLSFDLSLPGLLIDEPRQHLIWRGKPEAVQFGVTVQGTQQPGNVIGTVRVSQGGVPFGHVRFQLTIAAAETAAPTAAPPAQATQDWVKYKKAFISYASKDSVEVLKRAQMLARLMPNYFLDMMTLEPGERWEKGLYKHIDESDVFFLFWSTAAKKSKWVMKEVDYALAKKGKDESAPPEIIPMVIEGPPPVKPPRRLSHLHFNDMFLYVMAQRKTGSKKKGRPRTRRQP